MQGRIYNPLCKTHTPPERGAGLKPAPTLHHLVGIYVNRANIRLVTSCEAQERHDDIHSGVSATGRNGGKATRVASDNVVLLDRQYVWPGGPHGNSRLGLYRREHLPARDRADFPRSDLELRRPRSGDSKSRRFHSLECRPDAGGGGPREGRINQRDGEPLRASRCRVLPRAVRHRQRIHLPVSPMDL